VSDRELRTVKRSCVNILAAVIHVEYRGEFRTGLLLDDGLRAPSIFLIGSAVRCLGLEGSQVLAHFFIEGGTVA
jgi:hypothetical protein